MSGASTWWIAVRPDGTGYRGDERNFLAARGTTITAPTLTNPWYPAPGTIIYAETTPEAALAGMPHEARLVQVTGSPMAVDNGRAALHCALIGDEHRRHLAYGPAGPQIADLLDAARTISAEQALALADAWHQEKPLHWNGAWRAAWELLPSTQRTLVLADVRAAAQTGALAAARTDDRVLLRPVTSAADDAARSLLVRDLIGTPRLKLKQAHYDARTQVWRTVMGPLHPDDAATTGKHAPAGGRPMTAVDTLPQGEPLKQMLTTAEDLTPDQLTALAEALNPSWFLLWNDVSLAAKNAGLWDATNAMWRAIATAVTEAGGRAPLDPVVVSDAATAAATASSALLLRHLVAGDTTMTARTYEVLTAPWRTVVGPLHPKDPLT